MLVQAASRSGRFHIEFEKFDWGCDYYDKHGVVVPDDFIETLRTFDAIFLGAVGFPSRLPDHITLEPLIRIRQAFDLYACVRPARTYSGVRSPLAEAREVDMIVVRENSEGEYVSVGGNLRPQQSDEVAVQTAIHTRQGIDRILRYSFELARTRRKKLALITKSNAQRFGYVLWDRVLDQLAGEYADVMTERLHIDAATVHFVKRPHEFDIVVGSNLFGDILTDLSGAITGGLGLNPSANLNPERNFPSLFEPVHGSAPDITGKGIANPVGAILSGAMMLDWLGQPESATSIRAAVERALAEGNVTPDLGGRLTTEDMTNNVSESIE